MADVRGAACAAAARVEEACAAALERLAFQETRLPLVEHEALFRRGLGVSDVVEKELFAWDDVGGARLCLRPEATAAAVRHLLAPSAPAAAAAAALDRRLRYCGPMFRRERPQRGRHRQFTQAGGEWFAPPLPCPAPDALMATALHRALSSLSVEHEFRINSLGTAEERRAHGAALAEFLEARADGLSDTSRERLARGAVLRVLDSKHPADMAVVADGAPPLSAFLSAASARQLDEWEALLHCAGVPVRRDATLVRGLDYYNGPVFEVVPRADGPLHAQAALAAGGRYDGLAEALGGKPVQALGWALGVERVAALLPPPPPPTARPVVVACLSRASATEGSLVEEARVSTRVAARLLRALESGDCRGTAVRLVRASSARRALEAALEENALACVLVGSKEVAANAVAVRHLDRRVQESHSEEAVIEVLLQWLSQPTAPPH